MSVLNKSQPPVEDDSAVSFLFKWENDWIQKSGEFIQNN